MCSLVVVIYELPNIATIMLTMQTYGFVPL